MQLIYASVIRRRKQLINLTDKVILVTGAASGIGASTCILARNAGATIVAVDRSDEDSIKAGAITTENEYVASLDVTDEPGIEECVQTVITKFGRIDGLVNCAGISIPGPAHTLDFNAWKKTLDIHITGTFLVSRRVIQEMVKVKNGAIVNTSSVYGLSGGRGNIAYNTAKGGILQLTRSMAADYGSAGIRVNCVSPGYIDTPMSAMLKNAGDFRDKFVKMHALERPGQPEEVASANVFLLSDSASFITAANLPVDGGFSSTHIIP